MNEASAARLNGSGRSGWTAPPPRLAFLMAQDTDYSIINKVKKCKKDIEKYAVISIKRPEIS